MKYQTIISSILIILVLLAITPFGNLIFNRNSVAPIIILFTVSIVWFLYRDEADKKSEYNFIKGLAGFVIGVILLLLFTIEANTTKGFILISDSSPNLLSLCFIISFPLFYWVILPIIRKFKIELKK